MPAEPPALLTALTLRILRLLRCRPDDLANWDTGVDAARRSFLLMLVVLPVYAYAFTVLTTGEMDSIPFTVIFPLLGSDYILQWTAFPLMIAVLLKLAGMEKQNFPAFVIVTNGLSTFSAYAILPLLVLFQLGLMGEETLYLLMNLLFLIVSLVISRWAMLLFETGFGFALAVFMLNGFISQAISGVTMTLLQNYKAMASVLGSSI
jgi:hypothetical protein